MSSDARIGCGHYLHRAEGTVSVVHVGVVPARPYLTPMRRAWIVLLPVDHDGREFLRTGG